MLPTWDSHQHALFSYLRNCFRILWDSLDPMGTSLSPHCTLTPLNRRGEAGFFVPLYQWLHFYEKFAWIKKEKKTKNPLSLIVQCSPNTPSKSKSELWAVRGFFPSLRRKGRGLLPLISPVLGAVRGADSFALGGLSARVKRPSFLRLRSPSGRGKVCSFLA